MASQAISKVSVVSSNFEVGMKVFSGLGSVAAAAQGGLAIYNIFAGKTDADKIVDALREMTARLEASMDRVATAVKDGTQVSLWQMNREATLRWKAKILTRAAELASFHIDEKTDEKTKVKSFEKMVEVKSKDVSLAEWCEGSSGVLDELAEVLIQIRTWLEASDPGALNPVAQWDNVIRAGTGGRLFGGSEENVTTLMGQWFYAVLGLVQAATYVRNAALALYRALPNSKPEYRNVDRTLDLLGCMSTSTGSGDPKPGKGAWMAFEDTMKSYAKVAMLDDNDGVVSRESYQAKDNHQSGISEDHTFMTGGFVANPGANSYIAGMNFGFHDGAWGIHATIVTTLMDGTLLVRRDVAPGEAGAIVNASGEPLFTPYQLKRYEDAGSTYFAIGEIPELDTRYPLNRGTGTHNSYYVVTGFAVVKAGDVLVIKLQHGEMFYNNAGMRMVRNPAGWDVPGWGPEKIGDYYRIGHTVDKLHRGVSGTASLAPITNASFTFPNKHEVSIRTRNIWPYRPDVLQPVFLKQFSAPNLDKPQKLQLKGAAMIVGVKKGSGKEEEMAPATAMAQMPLAT